MTHKPSKTEPTSVRTGDRGWEACFGEFVAVSQDQDSATGGWDGPRVRTRHCADLPYGLARDMCVRILAACDYAEKHDRRKK